jgi:hypothetical protein
VTGSCGSATRDAGSAPSGLVPDRGDDGAHCVLWLDPAPREDRGEREELGGGGGEASNGGATSLGIISLR